MTTHNLLTSSRVRLTNVQEKRALHVFETLVDQSESARLATLDALIAEAPDVAKRARALLRAHHAEAERLPTQPPASRGSAAPDLPPPERIGVFRLGEVLGRGGMGSVYRAERCDGLFEHVVAIKLMRAARTSTLALQSFDSERRHLARLQHPNIAQLYDGGDLPDGRAYIVMELVIGTNIVDYVRAEELSRVAILSLFAAMCRAVQAAHQRLIVHADLKPSNILVAQDGVPKLLDFGVSRLMVPQQGDTPFAGGGSSAALTAAYASPERRRGEPSNIVDDVYSLGVILQELLTGQRPTQTTDEATDLPVDLHAIIDKATADESSRRYGGVNEMLADIQHFLANEPVAARKSTAIYRTQCFLRRHRFGVAAASVMLLALVGALLFTSQLYARAEAARLRADTRYGEVRQLSNYMLGDLQMRLTSMPQSLPVRKEIVLRGESYTRSLAVDEGAPLDVQLDAIAGLTQLAEMQGVPGQPNVGDPASARQSLQSALQIIERLQLKHLAPSQLAIATAHIGIDFAALEVTHNNDVKSAQRWLDAARLQLNATLALEPRNVEATRLDIEWYLRAADVANWNSDYQLGAQRARQAIDKLELAGETARNASSRAIALARGWDCLAEAIYYRGDYAAAVTPYQREVSIIEAVSQRLPGDVQIERNRLRAYWALGTTYLQIKRNVEALQALTTANGIGKNLSAQEPNDAEVQHNADVASAAYGQVLAANGRYAPAIDLLTATAQRREVLARTHPDNAAYIRDYAISLVSLADIHAQAGDFTRACKLYPQASGAFEQLRREGRSVALSENYSIKMLEQSELRFCDKRKREDIIRASIEERSLLDFKHE